MRGSGVSRATRDAAGAGEAAKEPKAAPAAAETPADEALRLHRRHRGKIQIMPKCPVRGLDDFAIWYTPGVAEPCKAIQRDAGLVYDFTNKGNCIAIVTNGSR